MKQRLGSAANFLMGTMDWGKFDGYIKSVVKAT